jgi:hypothetical protein
MWLSQSVVYPPDQPVRAYFKALADRDATKARQLGNLSGPLLADGALDHGYEPPSDLEFGDVTYGNASDETRRPNKSIAYVSVAYTLAGKRLHSSIEVYRNRRGPVRPWLLGSGTTGLLDVISGHLPKVSVAATVVETTTDKNQAGASHPVRVPPGVYTITPTPHPLLTFDALTASVPASLVGGDPVEIVLQPKLSNRAVSEVDNVVHDWLDQCIQQTRIDPPTCGFRYDAYADRLFLLDPRNVRWTIQAYPVLTPKVAANSSDGLITFGTGQPGAATVTFTSGDQSYTKQVPVDVRGTIALDEQGAVYLKTFGKQ